MNLPNLTGLRMPRFSLGLVLATALATGCSFIGPTGTNKAPNVYKAPDDNGDVILSVAAPEDAAKAVFVLRNPPDDVEFAELSDDSPTGANAGEPCADVEGFCVSFKADTLPANVYLMDVFIDDEDKEKAAATIPFVVGAAADPDASGTDEEGGGEDEEPAAEEEP